MASAYGPLTVRASEFLRIETGDSPEDEWAVRRSKASGGDTPARLDAAWWALEHGMVEGCVEMLRAACRDDPSHPDLARLARTLDRLDSRPVLRDTGDLRRAVGVPLTGSESDHVLLLSDHEPGVVATRLRLLEDVVTAYYLDFAFHGIELEVPPQKLVAVYVRDRETYSRFLDPRSAGAFRETMGYFHPTHRAVIGHDLRPPDLRSPFPARVLTGSDLIRIDRCQTYDLGTAAHEMVHQLVLVSGLLSDPRAFPQWLHEGLACQYELVRGGRWAGIRRPNDLRSPDLAPSGDRIDLAGLERQYHDHLPYRRPLYARAWAAVYGLSRSRPDAFFSWIDLLRSPDPTTVGEDAGRSLRLLTTAYGLPLDAIERESRATLVRTVKPRPEAAGRP